MEEKIINKFFDQEVEVADQYLEKLLKLPKKYHNDKIYKKLIDRDYRVLSCIISHPKFIQHMTSELLLYGLIKTPLDDRDTLTSCIIYGYKRELLTYDVVYEWCKANGDMLHLLSPEVIDENICKIALSSHHGNVYGYLPKHLRTEQFYGKYNRATHRIPRKLLFRYSRALINKLSKYERYVCSTYPYTFKHKRYPRQHVFFYDNGHIHQNHKIIVYGIEFIANNLLFMMN